MARKKDDTSTRDGDWEFNCNLCNYKLYLKNIRQIGVDGVAIPANEKALKALFECRLYRSLDESCKRILITAIRKLSHSSDSKPVRMSLMAMHIQTESEVDAEKLKKDSTGINLRALLDSLPSSVIVGEHETRVNDILYSLADTNKMSIKVRYPSWIRAIADVQEKTMIQVVYRALWFSNPYGVRNLGLRMLLQEEVPECWETYKKKEGKTLRELLLKYRGRISGRREFLANDTLYKLKDGCSMEMPPIPQCTCTRTVRIPVSFDRKVFRMVNNEVFVQLFRIAIREVLVNCGGGQASSLLMEELKNRCSGEAESDIKGGTLVKMSCEELKSRVNFLMRYDVLCYLLSKRHPEIWTRMTDSWGNKGSRKCRKDGLVEVMKGFEDFYLVTYKVRTPIITLLDSEGRDLRANAVPFVPTRGNSNSPDTLISEPTQLSAIPPMDNQFQRPQTSGRTSFNIPSSIPSAYNCGFDISPNPIPCISPMPGEQVGNGKAVADPNRLKCPCIFSGYSQLLPMENMVRPMEAMIPVGDVLRGDEAHNSNYHPVLPQMSDGYIDPTPRTRAQDSLKGLLGLMERPNGYDLTSGIKSSSSSGGNLPQYDFDTPDWGYGGSNGWDQISAIHQRGNTDPWATPSPYNSRNLQQPIHNICMPEQSSNISGSDIIYTPPPSLGDDGGRNGADFQEYYNHPLRTFAPNGPELDANEILRPTQRNNALDWIIACASPLNGVYNNMDASPGACWESMTSPYMMKVNRASKTD